MASISRDQFLRTFQGQNIDVTQLSPELKGELARAGIAPERLAQLAGRDGVVSGEAELRGLLVLATDGPAA